MRKTPVLAAVFILALGARGHGISLWEHSDVAGKNALLLNIGIFSSDFSDYKIPDISLKADYVLPIFPVSLGAYMKVPDEDNPNLKSFGARVGYHPDVGVSRLDFYVFYNFDFGWTRNKILREYDDEEQPLRFWDFRCGVRFIYGAFVGLYFETGYKFLSFDIGISIKIN